MEKVTLVVQPRDLTGSRNARRGQALPGHARGERQGRSLR